MGVGQDNLMTRSSPSPDQQITAALDKGDIHLARVLSHSPLSDLPRSSLPPADEPIGLLRQRLIHKQRGQFR